MPEPKFILAPCAEDELWAIWECEYQYYDALCQGGHGSQAVGVVPSVP